MGLRLPQRVLSPLMSHQFMCRRKNLTQLRRIITMCIWEKYTMYCPLNYVKRWMQYFPKEESQYKTHSCLVTATQSQFHWWPNLSKEYLSKNWGRSYQPTIMSVPPIGSCVNLLFWLMWWPISETWCKANEHVWRIVWQPRGQSLKHRYPFNQDWLRVRRIIIYRKLSERLRTRQT